MDRYEFVPKNPDGILRAIAFGRLSQPKDDEIITEQTMEASCDEAIKHARKLTNLEIKFTKLTEQISGLLKHRQTMETAYELIKSNTIDFVVCEDLGRVYRNPRHQYEFVQDILDCDTHVIAVNDGLDTRMPGWQTILGAAALRHGTVISDHQSRSRRTIAASFYRGGCVNRIRFGYQKLTLDQARSGQFGPVELRVMKLPELTPTIMKMIELLRQTGSFARVAEWCSENNVPYAPYQTEPWRGLHVKYALNNPMLHGERQFLVTKHRRKYDDGIVYREKNKNPLIKHYPELAHLSPSESADLKLLLKELHERNVALRNRQAHKSKPIARKNVFFPAHHVVCHVCKRHLWQFGDHIMKCPARMQHKGDCWCRVQFDQVRFRHMLINWLMLKIATFPTLIENFIELTKLSCKKSQLKNNDKMQLIIAQRDSMRKRLKKLSKLILMCEDDNSSTGAILEGEFKTLNKQLKKKELEIVQVENNSKIQLEELRIELGAEALLHNLKVMSDSSREFSDLLRKIFPSISIAPIQAIDSSQVWPRAIVKFNAMALLPEESNEIINEEFTLDVFTPSVQFQHREACVRLKVENPRMSMTKIGVRLGISNQSVWRCLRLHKQMLELGMSEPYRFLTEEPEIAARWKARPSHWKKTFNAEANNSNHKMHSEDGIRDAG